MKTKLIVIVGPTAVGKTALGITLAQRINGEIISGDSQQVYRQLAIGTAKATPDEQAAAKHYLIDQRDVWENYSVYDFVQEARQAITQIVKKGKVPIIVGGTGLYIQSLLEGYHLGGQVDHQQVLAYREQLEKLSNQELHEKVAQEKLTIIEPNRRRMIRKLELARFAPQAENHTPNYEVCLIGLTTERDRLYQRINERVDNMVVAGLFEEAKWLFDHYPDAQSARAIGYKELFPYFLGDETKEEAIELLKRNSRRFAKRQLTWFRNRMATPFYDVDQPDIQDEIFKQVDGFLLSKES